MSVCRCDSQPLANVSAFSISQLSRKFDVHVEKLLCVCVWVVEGWRSEYECHNLVSVDQRQRTTLLHTGLQLSACEK